MPHPWANDCDQGGDTIWFTYQTREQELVSVPNIPYGLRGGSPMKEEGLLLKGETKAAGQKAERADVSCNWLFNKDV